MKRLALVACLALASAAPGQAKQPTIAELLTRIEALEAEVKALKAQSPTRDPGIVGAIPDGNELRVMRVLRIEPIQPNAASLAKAEALEKDATKLEQDSTKAQPGDSVKGGDRSKATKIAGQLADQAKAKRAEAAKIRRDEAEQHHRLTGWNGRRFVILTTERDLTGAVTKVAAGDFVEWSGQRTCLSDRTDEYTVRTLSRADKPLNFVDPPATANIPGPFVPTVPPAPGRK